MARSSLISAEKLHTEDDEQNEDHGDDQKNDEDDLRDGRRAFGNAGEAQRSGDERDDDGTNGDFEHGKRLSFEVESLPHRTPVASLAPPESYKSDIPRKEAAAIGWRAEPLAMNTTKSSAPTGLRMSSDITGSAVKNLQSENIGSIEDLVLDAESGRVRFAILGIGGFLGLGETHVAVPWSAFQRNQDVDADSVPYLLDSTREQLEKAPRFDRDKLGALYSRETSEPIFLHYRVVYFE